MSQPGGLVLLLLSLHISAKHGVNSRLISLALTAKPVHHVAVEPDRNGGFGLWQNKLGAAKPLPVDDRRRVGIRPGGTPDFPIAQRGDTAPIRGGFRGRRAFHRRPGARAASLFWH